MTLLPTIHLDYQAVMADLNTICRLNHARKDKLALVNGRLEINEGGFTQAPIRLLTGAVKKDCDLNVVADHIHNLVAKSFEIFRSLQLEFEVKYDDVKLIKKRARGAALALAHLQELYKKDPRKEAWRKLCGAYSEFNVLHGIIKVYLAPIKAMEGPKEYVPDHSSPVSERKIGQKMPKGAKPKDITALVESANEQKTPEVVRTSVDAGKNVGVAVGVTLTAPLSLFKSAVCDPIVQMCNGRVTTRTPTKWLVENTQITAQSMVCDPSKHCNQYVRQLINVPLISDEHVDEFCRISKHLRMRFLGDRFSRPMEIASNNIDELCELAIFDTLVKFHKEMFNKDHFGENARTVLSALIKNEEHGVLTIRQFSTLINDEFHNLKWLDDSDYHPESQLDVYALEEWRENFEEGENISKNQFFLNHCKQTYRTVKDPKSALISFNNYIRVHEAIATNKNCEFIDLLWQAYASIPRIQRIFEFHKFNVSPYDDKRYIRHKPSILPLEFRSLMHIE